MDQYSMLDLIFPSSEAKNGTGEKVKKTKKLLSKNRNKIMKMYEQGFMCVEISKKFKVDNNTMSCFIKRNLKREKEEI